MNKTNIIEKSIVFSSDRLVLKTLDENYSVEVFEFYIRNKKFLELWEPKRSSEFYTRRYQSNLLINDHLDMQIGRSIKLALFKKRSRDSQKIIGFINYTNIIRGIFQSCFVGYKLDKEETGNGYMTEGLIASSNYLFDREKLHRIEANILPANKASIKTAENAGFVYEGISRKYLKINGVWQDHIHMVKLNNAIE